MTSVTRTPTRSPRAFLMVELLSGLVAGLLLIGICSYLFADSLYLQRIAAQHADRVAVVEHLSRELRDDVAAAGDWRFSDSRLELQCADATVTYDVSPTLVRRSVDGKQTHTWSATRLTFDARLQTEVRGNLFTLDFAETPPTKATRLSVRTDRLSFNLRKAGGR